MEKSFSKRKRGIISLLVVTAMMTMMAGCGGGTSKTSGKEPVQSQQNPGSNSQKTPEKPKELSISEIYKGVDRDQLEAKAKEEGQVTLYTSMNTEDAQPIIEAFEKKYGIKVVMWRAGDEKVTQRIITEYKANRFDVDAVETDGPALEILYREKISEPFESPYLKDLSTDAIPSHKNWIATRFNFFVAAYNKNKVKGDQIPKSYDDFLKPEWKGKFAVEAEDQEWFATLAKHWGEEKGMEYFNKLSENQPMIRKGHTLVTELVAAGEVPLALTVYNHKAENLKGDGAPIEWVPLEPTVGRPNGILLTKNSPHPHAALLYADFVLSPEGQEIIKSLDRVPSSTKVDTNLNKFKYIMSDPVIVLDEWAKWDEAWQKLFINNK